jgi:hypothetical protein
MAPAGIASIAATSAAAQAPIKTLLNRSLVRVN